LNFGQDELELDRRLRLPINYYGPVGTIPTFSFIDLLEDRVPASAIAGRAALVGVTAIGLGDNVVTPFSQTMPGVEVLATIPDTRPGRQFLRQAAMRDGDVAAMVLLGLAAFLLARLPVPMGAAGTAILLLAVWSIIAQAAFQSGSWVDMTFPAASILL